MVLGAIMNTLLAAGIAALVLLAACSQQATSSKNLIEDAPASTTTKSKIGVDVWALRGSNTGVEVKGQSAAGKVVHELKITVNTDYSCNAVKSYRDASGNVVASVQIKVDKNGKGLSRTSSGNLGDPVLCRDCMGNDLKATDPSAIPDSAVNAQVTNPPNRIRTPCERAQRRLASAVAAFESACDPNINQVQLCTEAGWALAMAMQDVREDCPEIAPLGALPVEERSHVAGIRERFPAT